MSAARQADKQDYLRQRARLFNPASTAKVSAGAPPSSDTVYLTAADSEGNAISCEL